MAKPRRRTHLRRIQRNVLGSKYRITTCGTKQRDVNSMSIAALQQYVITGRFNVYSFWHKHTLTERVLQNALSVHYWDWRTAGSLLISVKSKFLKSNFKEFWLPVSTSAACKHLSLSFQHSIADCFTLPSSTTPFLFSCTLPLCEAAPDKVVHTVPLSNLPTTPALLQTRTRNNDFTNSQHLTTEFKLTEMQ